MKDLTILFYTANVVPDKIIVPVMDAIKKTGYPIISISHKKIPMGDNVVVSLPRCVRSIYEQVLIGAKLAATEYVALTEDDAFYVDEHFTYRPEHFGYNLNRWSLHLREKVFSYRKRPVLSQCIANRESLINTLEERLNLHDLPDSICGEPGRLENTMGITPYGYETFETKHPNYVICHKWGVAGNKRLSDKVADYVEGIGSAHGLVGRFE